MLKVIFEVFCPAISENSLTLNLQQVQKSFGYKLELNRNVLLSCIHGEIISVHF